MKYAHLLHAFYGQHWHVLPETWNQFHTLLQRALAGQDIATPPQFRTRAQVIAHALDLPEDPSQSLLRRFPIVGPTDDDGHPVLEQMAGIGPVAIIPVHGTLGRRLSMLDLMCGGCDYLNIEQMAAQALEDPETKFVVFDFDSPGGMGSGLAECCAALESLEKEKPTIAFTDDTCASAAYALATRCGDILASPTSRVGSVGTIICGEDNSGEWAQQGRVLELFTSAPLKGTGADGKKWTDQDRAYLQERMMQADAAFKSGIRQRRPQLTDEAYSGAWFFAGKDPEAPGQSGMDVGLIDAFAPDLRTVVEGLLALP